MAGDRVDIQIAFVKTNPEIETGNIETVDVETSLKFDQRDVTITVDGNLIEGFNGETYPTSLSALSKAMTLIIEKVEDELGGTQLV